MKIITDQFVVKLSVSDMKKARDFYQKILGFSEQKIYTINCGGNYGTNSYMQMSLKPDNISFALGLFKDIEQPFLPLPQSGSVPSFIVDDIDTWLNVLQRKKVIIDVNPDGSIINTDKSDKGYTDRFFFFRDPDNNSLVMRENTGRQLPEEQSEKR